MCLVIEHYAVRKIDYSYFYVSTVIIENYPYGYAQFLNMNVQRDHKLSHFSFILKIAVTPKKPESRSIKMSTHLFTSARISTRMTNEQVLRVHPSRGKTGRRKKEKEDEKYSIASDLRLSFMDIDSRVP